MQFIELTTSKGVKFLIDVISGWEVYDNGKEPAHWVNHSQGRNLDAQETYEVVRKKIDRAMSGGTHYEASVELPIKF